MTEPAGEPILTLEPLIDIVRESVEGAGWMLSGLQKTTSHQFEGRWEGESTRSAYLFFHAEGRDGADFASIDAYLDETSRGLTGNLALVVDLVPLGLLGGASDALGDLGGLSARHLRAGRRRPLTLRLRLDDASAQAESAESEIRFKVSLTRAVIQRGPSAVKAFAVEAVRGFEAILASPDLAHYLEDRR